MSDEGTGGSLLYKIVGGLFATIVAPIVVALGVKLLDSPPPQQAGGPAPAAAPPDIALDAAAHRAGEATGPLTAPSDALQPKRTLRLFNGKDLSGFDTYLGPAKPKGKPLGINHDPKKVFTVHDGMIHVTGELLGGLVTHDEFQDYRLTVVYRWGDETWPPRKENARTSGVLLHSAVHHESDHAGRRGPRSIRCIIAEGETGGLMLLGSTPKDPISIEATAEHLEAPKDERRMPHFQFRPGAPSIAMTHGYLVRLNRPPGWRDVKGFHGRRDIEYPAGEWNTLVCTCRGPRISIRLNGKLVNEVSHSSLRRGRIMLQSSHAEIYFRRVDLEQFAPAKDGPAG